LIGLVARRASVQDGQGTSGFTPYFRHEAFFVITKLPNKMIAINHGTHSTVCDGPVLGGCGFGDVGDPMTFVPELWTDLIRKYDVKSVLDVGCGYGYSTRWFRQEGIDVDGIEGSVSISADAVSDDVLCHDFRDGRCDAIRDTYDLGWCSEFLEHMDARYEPCYMAALARCRFLAVTAAMPGYGGHHHVNEQPPEYWIERFRDYGFAFRQDETNRLRTLCHEQHPIGHFQGTGLFFERVKSPTVRTHWSDLGGNLAHPEAEYLQEKARGMRALVIGGDSGQMALALAETAKQVTCVGVQAHCLGDLLVAIRTAKMSSRIEVIDDGLDSSGLAGRRFEMVIVDTLSDVVPATDLAASVILPSGSIVWVDWSFGGIQDSVIKTIGSGASSIVGLGPMGILETAMWQVMVTLPHSRSVELQSYKSLRMATLGRFASVAAEMDMSCGSLTHNFNTLLSQSLDWRDEGKVTHMAMIHSDITAERGWLDLLAEEMHLHGLVAISGVVAIKDPDQDRTSTAIGSKARPWDVVRYIHLRDQKRLPVTFTAKDVCETDDEVLLINTGLMLIDLRHEFWDSFTFVVLNQILKGEGGKRKPQFRPEDWEMSRELEKAGLPYGSTWRPFCEHLGGSSWPNRAPLTQVIHNA
jgi:SAM-dependent methyltransferase